MSQSGRDKEANQVTDASVKRSGASRAAFQISNPVCHRAHRRSCPEAGLSLLAQEGNAVWCRFL